MSDYQHSRNYPPNHLSGSGSGSGLFWVLFAIAGLGILVLIGAFGSGSTATDHPGGAGANPVVVPADPATQPDAGVTIVE